VRSILENTPTVRELVGNGWVNLHAFNGEGSIRKCCGLGGRLAVRGRDAHCVFPRVDISDYAKECLLPDQIWADSESTTQAPGLAVRGSTGVSDGTPVQALRLQITIALIFFGN
jgi:hypothetical protein